jgi:hypothetical protein
LHDVVAYGDVLRHENLGVVGFVLRQAKAGETEKVLPDERRGREEGNNACLGSAGTAFQVGGSGVGSVARFEIQIDVEVVAGEGHAVFLLEESFGAIEPDAREDEVFVVARLIEDGVVIALRFNPLRGGGQSAVTSMAPTSKSRAARPPRVGRFN